LETKTNLADDPLKSAGIHVALCCKSLPSDFNDLQCIAVAPRDMGATYPSAVVLRSCGRLLRKLHGLLHRLRFCVPVIKVGTYYEPRQAASAGFFFYPSRGFVESW